MSRKVAIYKVKELPPVQEPGAIYFVKADGANAATQYVTDNDGNSFPIASESLPTRIDLGTF